MVNIGYDIESKKCVVFPGFKVNKENVCKLTANLNLKMVR